jgi:hypothetical protein
MERSFRGEITVMLGKHKTTDKFEKTGAFMRILWEEQGINA